MQCLEYPMILSDSGTLSLACATLLIGCVPVSPS